MKRRLAFIFCMAFFCAAGNCVGCGRTLDERQDFFQAEEGGAAGIKGQTGQGGRTESIEQTGQKDITGVQGQAEPGNGGEEGDRETQMDAEDLSLPEEASEEDDVKYVYIDPEGGSLAERIRPPEGFTRVEEEGFGVFLREYPLLEDGAPVLMYDGSQKWNQSAHAAVFAMELVKGDLQQCADSCMRLYAEYFYQNGNYDKIAFHLTNGFLVDFVTWSRGGRVSVQGNKTEWVVSAEPSDSRETFEKYLRFVFTYAGTLSMDGESERIEFGQLQAGDLFLKGGSPGHVVMVLDVCENESGERAFLLGQGYMPAQQFHVLKNPAREEDPWYYLSEAAYPFETPEYVFSEGALKRPVYDR